MGNARTDGVEHACRAGAAACAFALISWPALAASLGDADVRSFLGQPLDARVAIRAASDELVDLSCVEARVGETRQLLPRSVLRIDETLTSRTLIVRTTTPVERSGFALDIRVQCGGETANRVYTLDIPAITQSTGASAPATSPSAAPSAASAAPPQAGIPSHASLGIVWTTAAGDTLRAIARGLYPASVALQDAYIAKMREANPGLEQSADQPLAAGVSVALPDMRTFANESPRYAEQSAQPAPPASPQRARPAKAPPATADNAVPRHTAAAPQSAPSKASKPADTKARQTAQPPQPERLAAKPSQTAAPRTADKAPPAAVPSEGSGFRLRLSGAEMDLSRSRGVTEATRASLRDKQIILDADDQVAALLTLKNTVKDLESRINEMHVTLSKTAQLVAAPPPVQPAKAPPGSATSAPPTTSPAPVAAPPQAAVPAPSAAPAASSPAIAALPAPVVAPPPSAPPAKAQEPAQAITVPTIAAPASTTVAAPSPAPVTEPAPSAEPKPVRAEKSVAAPAAETRSYRSASTEPHTPWWNSIWVWVGAGVALTLALIAWLLRRGTGSDVDDAGLVPSEPTAGFSDWSSEPSDDQAETTPAPPPSRPRRRNSVVPQIDANSAPNLVQPAPYFDKFASISARSGAGGANGAADQLPQFIGGPPDDGTAALDLDIGPGMHVDFPVFGDDGAEDKARRLHYMEGRFPELANRTIGIENPDTVIDAARHYFEDGHVQHAMELLTYSLEEYPGELRYWLALFEVYRLERKVDDFNALAMRFKNVHGGTDAWPKVQHIGRDLDPLNPLYAPALGQLGVPEDQEFDAIAENWLNVPMDFTSDALIADLRNGLLHEHGVEAGELKRLSVASYS